ncbi:hypothetical protein ABDX87_02905 [Pseudomonas abietaniphila]|uniref:hypothetical protein n=1 Tax=Pseudomonas abietaniphila TaxID=89065 RepID=UPI0032166A1C
MTCVNDAALQGLPDLLKRANRWVDHQSNAALWKHMRMRSTCAAEGKIASVLVVRNIRSWIGFGRHVMTAFICACKAQVFTHAKVLSSTGNWDLIGAFIFFGAVLRYARSDQA